MLTINDWAHFTWSYGYAFFLETKDKGNWIWNDPDYPGGNGTIVRFHGGYEQWIKEIGIPYGRDKGFHRIGDYCGKDVIINA